MALFVAGLLFGLTHSIIESSRAAFIADVGTNSATRALGRGVMQLLRRPFSTLLSYLLITAIGCAIAMAAGIGRMYMSAVGVVGLALAMVLPQLVVLGIGWVWVARLFALAEVARSLTSSRSSGMPPAL